MFSSTYLCVYINSLILLIHITAPFKFYYHTLALSYKLVFKEIAIELKHFFFKKQISIKMNDMSILKIFEIINLSLLVLLITLFGFIVYLLRFIFTKFSYEFNDLKYYQHILK
jgi:hypothetical protein